MGRQGDCRSHGGRRSSDRRPGIDALGDGARGVAPEETRENVGVHGFWREGTTAVFDVLIVNLDAISNLCMIPDNDFANAEKEKKYKYF